MGSTFSKFIDYIPLMWHVKIEELWRDILPVTQQTNIYTSSFYLSLSVDIWQFNEVDIWRFNKMFFGYIYLDCV